MTKCKRMLVAILILSMLSSNVAYAAGTNMGVNVAPVETTVEEAIASTVEEKVDAVETTKQDMASVVDETVKTTETITEEIGSSVEITVDETESEMDASEASGEENVETTVEATEESTVSIEETMTDLETEETTTEPSTETEEATTQMESTTEEFLAGMNSQASSTKETIAGWLAEMVPESYTLYSDGYSAITVLECPDANVNQCDVSLGITMKETGNGKKLDLPEMETAYTLYPYDKYSMENQCFYRIAKGKENGTTSVVITMTYDGASASVTVPVTITNMPEGYAKINDPGLYDDFISWSLSKDWFLDQTEMDKVRNKTSISIDISSFPAYLSATDLSQYFDACNKVTITSSKYNYAEKYWQFNYDALKKIPITELEISYDSELTSMDLGQYSDLEKITISYTINLQTLTFSKSCENLSYFKIDSEKLKSITVAEEVVLPQLKEVNFANCKSLTDVSFFAKTPNVENVQLNGCSALSDVSDLKNCKKLTGQNAINIYGTAVSGADIIDLLYLKDMELYVGTSQYLYTNVYSNLGLWHIASDSDLISVDKSIYSSLKSIKAVNPGMAKVKVYSIADPEVYREFCVYVKHYAGITGQLGELVSAEQLPEVSRDPWGNCVAIWDKVNKKVVDIVDKQELVENVTNYAGCWVYGMVEDNITDPYYDNYTVPYYYAGITVAEDGVHSYIREYDSESTSDATWPTKIVHEDTLQTDLVGKSIKQIGSGCILTEDGVLYCISSENELLQVATGVTEFLDYNGNSNGIIYRKGNTLYNSMTGTKKIRTDITTMIQGSSYVTSSKCTYKISRWNENWYAEATYPKSQTDSSYVSKVLKQIVRWGSLNSEQYHLLEDGILYNGSNGILDTDVKSIDALGYIKTVNGEDVRHVFTGEVASEFVPDGTWDSKYLGFDFMLGKEGLYRQNTSFVLSDVAAIGGADGVRTYAIRTDGSIWQLPYSTSADLPKKIYPIEAESVDPVEEATAIAFASDEIVLDTEAAQQVSVNCIPEGSVAGKITYSIDNHRIATVTPSGMLRAVKNGETTLHAESENGLSASCTVKVVLPVKMTGISVSENDLEFTLKEGDSKKVTVLYTPEDTTEDRTITWTSSDAEKVSVDADGTIHALKGTMGTPVTITGVSAVHENLKVTCKVSVNKILTEEEIVIPQGITVTNNVTKTLADITLPEGWAFKEPETKLTEHGEKSFAAIYTKEYYVPAERDITILINHIHQITISGNCILEANESVTHSLELLTEGMGEVQDCYSVDWKIKDTTIVAIDGSNKDKNVTVKGKKVGTTKLTATVTLKNAAGEVCETLTAESELNIKPAGVVENVKIILGEDALSHGLTIGEEDATIHVPYNQASDEDNSVIFAKNYSFTIDAECYMKGKPVEGTAVKWTTSDKKVAAVKTTNGVTKVTVKADGVAVLTATAQDEGKSKATVIVSIEDYTPRLENTTLTLNKALEDGSLFKMYPAYERTFADEILVYEKVGGALTESTIFKVTKDENVAYGYRLNLKDDVAYTSVGTKNYSNLYLRTNVSGEGIYDIPVKIKVVAKLPSVTIKQTDKVNLFYTDDMGRYTIAAKDATISSVEYISKATDAALPQFEGEWNGEAETLTISQQNITEQNYKSTVNKGTVRITFEGYRPEAYGTKTAYEKAVTVSKEYKQPQWVLTSSKLTRYAALSDQISVGVYDKKDKTKTLIAFTEDEITLDTAKLKNTYSLEQIADDKMYIRVTGSKASETLPILLQKDNFRAAKKLTIKLTLKKEDVLPAYSISAKNITLNKNFAGEEKAVLTLKAKTESDQRMTGVNVYLNEEAYRNKEVYQNEEVSFTYEEETGQLRVGLQTIVVASKYEFLLVPVMSTEDESIELAKTKLKVTVVDKAPALKLTAKGTINPIDRKNTSVQITPKISNLQGAVTAVSIINENGALFDATVENGKIVIRAKEASEETKLINKNKYKLTLSVTTQSGHVFENVSVTITPKQGALKAKASVNKITCFKPVKGVKYYVPLTFTVTKTLGAEIETIKLLNNTDNFVYDAESEILYLKNADLLAAKNHKLTFEIKAKGSCDNVKATKVTVTVSLKK